MSTKPIETLQTRAFVLVPMLLALGFLAGCSGGNNNPSDTSARHSEAPGITAAGDADSAPPVTKSRTTATAPRQASRPLPDGYPADIAPIYQPSNVTIATRMGSGRLLQYMVIVEAGDSVEVVAKSLVDYYKGQGAKVIQTPLNEEGVGQTVASMGGYGIQMTYSAGDKPGTTRISYHVRPQQTSR